MGGFFPYFDVFTQPNTHVSGKKIAPTPGVGQFKLRKPVFQRTRPSSVFKSTAARMPRVTTALPPNYVKVALFVFSRMYI